MYNRENEYVQSIGDKRSGIKWRERRMQFNSYIFILLYLPIIVIGYFIVNKINIRAGKTYLIVGSAAFYLYGGISTTLILGFSIVFNLLISKIISIITKHRKIVLILAIIGNLGLLFYYKYSISFISNWNLIFKTDYHFENIILPIGISFFTFQQIAYLVNIYQNTLGDVYIADYLAYILFFPKLLMGPITEPKDFISQINNSDLKKVNWNNISCGVKIFSFGLFKKLVLADTFANAVVWGYNSIDVATSMDWFLIMLCYTFEIYFDFSGYSDMAVGIAAMLNIKLPMNFDSPYIALSIRDFWKRWHISLTDFMTKYIYIPLGGNKEGKIRTYINILIVFLISGIWHGANWTFILWGAIHGLLSIIDRIFEKTELRLIEVVRWVGTFGAVNVLWLLFRSDSIAQWKLILCKIFSFQNTTISDGLIRCFELPETVFLTDLLHLKFLSENIRGFWMAVFLGVSLLLCLIPKNNYKNISKNNALYMMIASVAFVWAFLCLGSESVFVYYNF